MGLGNVLITGIHKGLGHSLARGCLEAGATVYGVSRTEPDDLAGLGDLRFAALDLGRLDRIPGVLAGLLEGVEELDLVILNAGMLGEIKDLRDTALDEIGKVMDVNVWANKVLLDVLIGSCTVEQVVAISSGSAFNGSGGWGAYSISKSALNLLIRVYAHEHPEIHFTALAPGLVHSDMLGYVLSLPDDPRYAANDRIRRAVEESRTFTPAQAAASVLARLRDLVDQPSGAYVDVRGLS